METVVQNNLITFYDIELELVEYEIEAMTERLILLQQKRNLLINSIESLEK
jgi:hypothetical protein